MRQVSLCSLVPTLIMTQVCLCSLVPRPVMRRGSVWLHGYSVPNQRQAGLCSAARRTKRHCQTIAQRQTERRKPANGSSQRSFTLSVAFVKRKTLIRMMGTCLCSGGRSSHKSRDSGCESFFSSKEQYPTPTLLLGLQRV